MRTCTFEDKSNVTFALLHAAIWADLEHCQTRTVKDKSSISLEELGLWLLLSPSAVISCLQYHQLQHQLHLKFTWEIILVLFDKHNEFHNMNFIMYSEFLNEKSSRIKVTYYVTWSMCHWSWAMTPVRSSCKSKRFENDVTLLFIWA